MSKIPDSPYVPLLHEFNTMADAPPCIRHAIGWASTQEIPIWVVSSSQYLSTQGLRLL
jgi:hypothetical protein